MFGLKCILLGFASIFAPMRQSKSPKMKILEEELQSYLKMSDKERLAKDWQAIYGDMNKAMDEVKELAHGQQKD